MTTGAVEEEMAFNGGDERAAKAIVRENSFLGRFFIVSSAAEAVMVAIERDTNAA